MLILKRTFFTALLSLRVIFGDDSTGLPPLPSELPVLAPATPAVPPVNPVIRRPRIVSPRAQAFPGGPTAQPVSTVRPYQAATVGDDVLSWDSLNKEYTAQAGELTANFTFAVTNVSKTNVIINWVRPSCGCTVAKLPPVPWTLAPGEGGNIDLSVDLRNKFGVLSKYVSVDTSQGQKLLNLKITVPNNPSAGALGGMDARSRNMQLAMADRQAVFRGDCASCHAVPTAGKKGEALYQAACSICHDAPHRATMVPDLRALKNVTGKDYWAHWVTNGKPGSLMPAFAAAQGGPLNDEQIQSLTEFLNERFPKTATATAALPVPTSPISAKN
ncbi:MAG TPA: c-type cytochrome [Verrucomicrobiae bacterium]|nr:c-type cytochrome [Verrucomicrobiae bacterium]